VNTAGDTRLLPNVARALEKLNRESDELQTLDH
jgi:hypothetical protein